MVGDIDTDRIFLNDEEVSAIKTIAPPMLTEDLKKNKNLYTPWLILAIEHMRKQKLIRPDVQKLDRRIMQLIS